MTELNGKKIVTDPNICTRTKRLWKERLFSRPWKPFKRWDVMPDENIYRTDHLLIMHPIMLEKLKKELT